MDIEKLMADGDDGMEGQAFEFFGKGGTFKSLKNISEESMEAIYSIAHSLYQSSKYDESLKIFQFLCFYDHFNKKYFMGLGACLQVLKNFKGALEIFSLANVLDSDDPRPLVYIGDCHLALGDDEKAKHSYSTAIEWAGNNPEYLQEKQRAEGMLANFE
ncbi:MAG: SycD/LcrH family type III secretion system chaperone [Candidatus Endonucleobacter sp. (ex Gigantidas childressi)]|nr:SycD/LcrH family type III secretion system chaperone [Candidatus Endonucleobacter sp. (ex Gigantidas childressi)]